ncbi:hypothetical protein AGMMS4956_17910 [Bacteroidia bacterium]|nr:hypothetical protein AGMMS4956_17910 [Bacteroidia bacterium]
MTYFRFIIFASAVLASLAASAKKNDKNSPSAAAPAAMVQALATVQHIDSAAFVYSLPRTVLRVKVVVERTQFTRGLYAEYAGKHLGIPKVSTRSATYYSLESLSVRAMRETDPAQIYVVQPSSNAAYIPFLKMSKDGLIFLLPRGNRKTPTFTMEEDEWNMPEFTNVGVDFTAEVRSSKKSKVAASAETADETIEAEMAEVVAVRSEIIHKDKETQSLDAAKFLANLRKRKFELITAEIESVFASNDALKVALAELKILEQQYLELFVGKTQKSQTTYFYDIVPAKDTVSYPLFSFSAEKGIGAAAGHPITLQLQAESETNIPLLPNNLAFKYRIPSTANLTILDGSNELFRGRYLIFQWGQLVNLPIR